MVTYSRRPQVIYGDAPRLTDTSRPMGGGSQYYSPPPRPQGSAPLRPLNTAPMNSIFKAYDRNLQPHWVIQRKDSYRVVTNQPDWRTHAPRWAENGATIDATYWST